MALANHVHRQKSGRYHARLRVPLDLVEMVGKKEPRQRRGATEDDLQRVTYYFFREELEFHHRERQSWPRQAEGMRAYIGAVEQGTVDWADVGLRTHRSERKG